MKRVFDVVVSILLLFILTIPALVVIGMVYLKIGRPIFFRQVRPGLRGELFEMVKFRTMSDARDDTGDLLPDSERLSRFGEFLRSTSIDELPELWNVLIGDMSLVGPRPLLPEYLQLYNSEQARRHEVRPGITGWAQVNGRNTLSWNEKFKFDVWYVDHHSFWLDMKILWFTFKKVVVREGISAAGNVTMPHFTGDSNKE